jgi:hypothetical protein
VAGGDPLQWITDPLDGVTLSAEDWAAHLWMCVKDELTNAAVSVSVSTFTTLPWDQVFYTSSAELPVDVQDLALNLGPPTALVTLEPGNRLIIRLYLDNAADPMASGYTIRLSYNGSQASAEGDSYLVAPDGLTLFAKLPQRTIDRVRRNLQDASINGQMLGDDTLADSIEDALVQYSRQRPRLVYSAVPVDGTSRDYPLPELWVEGLSSLRGVIYSSDGATWQPVDDNGWYLAPVLLGSGFVRVIRFASAPPNGTADQTAVAYTTRHVHTTTTDTLPSEDYPAVTWLAASYAAQRLAARGAAGTDPTMGADGVARRDETQRWAQVAKMYLEKYEAHVGIASGTDGEGNPPAMGFADWDVGPYGGRDYLYHSVRLR